MTPALSVNAAIDKSGNTLLHVACIQADYTLCSMLLVKGADYSIANNSGVTPLMIVQALDSVRLLRLFDRHGAVVDLKKYFDKRNKSKRYTKDKPKIKKKLPLFLPQKGLAVCNAAYLGLKELVQEFAQVGGFKGSINTNDENMQSPLMKAAYKGHVDILQVILDEDKRLALELDSNGLNALMWACIGKRLKCVQMLCEQFPECINQQSNHGFTALMFSAMVASAEIASFLISRGANAKLQSNNYLTALQIAAMMLHKDAFEEILMHDTLSIDKFKELHRKYWFPSNETQKPLFSSSYNLLADGSSESVFKSIPLKKGSDESISSEKDFSKRQLKKKPMILQTDIPLEQQKVYFQFIEKLKSAQVNALERTEKMSPKRRSKGLIVRQGMNLDRIMGNNATLMYGFTDTMPKFGTALDVHYSKIYSNVFHLIHVANKNLKHEYVSVAANICHLATDLVKEIEAIEIPEKVLIKSAVDLLLERTRAKSKVINTELCKQLMLSTRIAMGVWPPPKAVSEMIKAAVLVARGCRDIIDLTLCLGFLPISKEKIDVQIDNFGDELKTPTTPSADKLASLKDFNFEEYKRQYRSKLGTGDDIQLENASQVQLDNFTRKLNHTLVLFVNAVGDLKKSCDGHFKEEYISQASSVLSKLEQVIDEINQYEPLHDSANELVVDEEDVQEMEEKVKIPVQKEALPLPVDDVLVDLVRNCRRAGQVVLEKANEASGPWVQSTRALKLVQLCVPLAVSVKVLVTVANKMSLKIWKNSNQDQMRKAAWKRQCMQSEQVKQVFQMWSTRFKNEGQEKVLADSDLEALHDSDEGLVVDQDTIKGGRLQSLVERATWMNVSDENFGTCLLMTHHSFCSSLELLDAIVKRYEIVPPYGLSKEEFDLFVSKKVIPVRMTSANLLKQWIQLFCEQDFGSNPVLLDQTRKFIDERLLSDFEDLAEEIYSVLMTKSQSHAMDLTFRKPTTEFRFDQTDPLFLAKQLTLLEFELFKRVSVYECLDQIWGEKRRKELLKIPGSKEISSNTAISRMIQHTNRLTMWIASCILNLESIKSRVSCVKYFIQVGMACKELGNYNAITSIIAALCMGPISRLYETWNSIQEKSSKSFEDFQLLNEVVSAKSQYAGYRKILKELEPPAIPFLGVYLTDLTFIELGNPDFLPGTHFINFEKRRKVFQIIREIERFQSVSFCFDCGLDELDHFWNDSLLSEDEMYERSLEFEPRLEDEDSFDE